MARNEHWRRGIHDLVLAQRRTGAKNFEFGTQEIRQGPSLLFIPEFLISDKKSGGPATAACESR
jgi:hypothetical protein